MINPDDEVRGYQIEIPTVMFPLELLKMRF
jgi:hypothetical protein